MQLLNVGHVDFFCFFLNVELFLDEYCSGQMQGWRNIKLILGFEMMVVANPRLAMERVGLL